MAKKLSHLWFGLGLFAITLTTYIALICPTIHPRDNPDIITSAATLGIAHPPGYPLYTILGFLASKIPIGTIPYRINLMSAVFSAATVFVIYLIIYRLTKKVWPALIGAATLAASYFFFLQSLYADYLSLNNLLVALEILFLLIWREKKQAKYLYLTFLFIGLAYSHHQISIAILPAVLYLIFVTDKNFFIQRKKILSLLGMFLLGLIPFVYLPIRAAQHPIYSWGEPNTWSGLYNMIFRKDYGATSFSFIKDAIYRIWDWIKLISFKEYAIVGALLGLAGIYKLKKEKRELFTFFILAILFTGPVLALLSNVPNQWVEMIAMERFFIFSYMVFAILIGLGADLAIRKSKLATFGLALLPLLLAFYNAPIVNLKNYYFAYDLGQNILKSLPENAVLYAGTDVPLFELWYLQKVEHVREDVKVMPGADPKLVVLPDNVVEQNLKIFPDYNLPIEELVNNYQIYSTNNYEGFWGPQISKLMPEGIVYRLMADPNWYKEYDAKKSLDDFANYQMRGEYVIAKQPERLTHEILYYYVNGWANVGLALQKADKPAEAAKAYSKALAIDNYNIPVLANLSQTFSEREMFEEAINGFKLILKVAPDYMPAKAGLASAQQKLYEKQENKN